MFSIRWKTVSAVLSVLLMTGAAEAAPKLKPDDAVARQAKAASPMSAKALDEIYSGKTWKWKDGGGFFSADGHKFTAWSQKGRAITHAQGSWYVTNRGELCMKAYWQNKMGDSGNITCFLHRRKAGVIYQKPSLKGDWYVFRSNPVRPTDEARKLVRGDLVSKGLARITAKAK